MKQEPSPAIHMEKQLGWALRWVGQGLWGFLMRVTHSFSQVDRVSGMAPAYLLSVDGCDFFSSVVVRLPSNLISDSSD